jgi:glycosyltransferase involved in cell wall biosynthesis
VLQAKPNAPRVGYVLKVYPRFSETFIVTEILAREASGEELEIFSLRPPADPRFHPELARVQAPVNYVPKPAKLSEGWAIVARAQQLNPEFAGRWAQLLPQLSGYDPIEVHQGIELATMALERGITHLHAHFGSLAARTAEIAAALSGLSYSFTAHAKDIFHQDVDRSRLARTLAHASHVVTISEYNYRYLRSMYPAETAGLHLVYNGLELERFPYAAPQVPGQTLRVAAVGRLVEKKGFDLLIESAAELRNRGLRLDVRIAGGGMLETELADQITSFGLEGTVRLLGPRTQREVADLLRWADVFAAPCVVGEDGNADGLPTVLLEAMAMGVPAIASDVTGIPEVIHPAQGGAARTGILIRNGVTADLTAALVEAAQPDFDRAGIAAAARQCIEANFDSTKQARRLRQLVEAPEPAVPAAESVEVA